MQVLESACYSKVNDDQTAMEIVSLSKHYVLKLDVSMHEPPLVTVVKSMAHLLHDHLSLILRQPAAMSLDIVPQSPSSEVLHEEHDARVW